MKQTVLFVMGLPGTGKTTLSTKLSEELGLPLLSRDAIKVIILDSLGWADREWSKKVGKTSYDILRYMLREQLKSGGNFVVESEFRPEFVAGKLAALQSAFGFETIQVICTASEDTIIQRWQERAAKDVGHPSHTEGEAGLNDLRDAIKAGPRQPLDLRGTVIHVDTDAVSISDEAAIVEQIRGMLQ